MSSETSSKKTETKTSESRVPADPSRNKALSAARVAIEKNAENLKLLSLTDISGFTDYFLICSGTSDRQVQTIADAVQSEMDRAGVSVLSVEGYSEGRWVLIDMGDVVVHVFLDALREYYDLENLWSDAPRVPIPSEYYGPGATRLN